MRTTPTENAELGALIAKKLNASRGPVTLLIPLKGVSAIDKEGQKFHVPPADAALFAAVRGNVDSKVRVIELDLHINDPEFADAIADHLLTNIKRK